MKRYDDATAMRCAWLLREDARGGLPTSAAPTEAFRIWWSLDGRREYPAWSERPADENLSSLFDPLPDWPRYGRFGMTPLLKHLIDRHAILRKKFAVSTERGLWHAIAWWHVFGLREFGLLHAVDAATLAALDETPPFLDYPEDRERHQPSLTWLMFFAWRCIPKLQDSFDLREAKGRGDYLRWFCLDGLPHLKLEPLVAQRWRDWLLQSAKLQEHPNLKIPRAVLLLARHRPILRQAVDIRNPQHWRALARWMETGWRTEPALRWLTHDGRSVPRPARSETLPRPFGMNLIGFAFGELGIGEDVRMAAAACESAGIPFKVVNIPPGGKLRQADTLLAEHIVEDGAPDEAPYAINLFCLTGFDTAGAFLRRGRQLFEGRYNIGWWPWELPVWPKDWRIAFDLVDEVWAATEFTRAMYAAVSPGPVIPMPLPVSVARVQSVTRQQLGLPGDRFLFLYVFDFNSYLARKNPFAAVNAFRRAFPVEDRSVGLVLKTMNSNPKNPAWRRFLRECAKDPRIVLLDRTLDRGEVLGLIQACDAYVSLHRSEGFGRTLAEAMLFGKPVVGTDFSGNADFLTSRTGFPVKWQRRKAEPGEYPFITAEDDAWWAEPDPEDAARQLRAARAAAQAPGFAQRVRDFAERQFSPRRIGLLLKRRIAAIRPQD